MPVSQNNTGKDEQHACNVYPGKIFLEKQGCFHTAENGYQVAKEGGSASSQFLDGFVPDKKTNNGGAKAQVENSYEEVYIPMNSGSGTGFPDK